MRTEEHDHEEKTALLKCANEEIYDGVRQPCCRCGGVAIWHPAQLPHIFLDQPLQKGSDRIDRNGDNRGGIFSAAISTSV